MNGYNLLRAWYNFKFDNPHKAKAKHSDFYCYLVDQWNRLGQKECFGLPTIHTMECLGIGSYNTYKQTLDDLIEFGFVKIIKDSKNQHHSKIIALSNIDKATDKPLDKATAKAPDEAIDTITKQRTKNKEEGVAVDKSTTSKTLQERQIEFGQKVKSYSDKYPQEMLKDFFHYWTEKNDNGKKMRFEMQKVFDIKRRLATWHSRTPKTNKPVMDDLVKNVYKQIGYDIK